MNSRSEVKVPVIIQMDALECGAACLAMVLAYHGKWLPMAEVRRACGVSRDGSSGKNLLLAARSYGLVGKGRRVGRIDPKEIPLPCILHYNQNHFVVFCGYRNGKAVINDPARGRILVPMEEFERAFHGFLMQCVPGEDFAREGKPPRHLDFIWKLVRAYKKEVLFLLLAGVASTVIGVISPALSQVFLDQALSGTNEYLAQSMAFLLIVMLALQAVVAFTDTLTKYRVNRRVAMDSSVSFFKYMLTLPMEFFSQRMIGDLAGRQKSNETISQGIVQQAAPALQQLATIILYVVIMVMYEPSLAVIGIVMSVFSLILSLYVSAKQIDVAKAQIQNEAMVRSYSMFGLNSIESIKASGAERGFYACWAGIQAEHNNQSAKIANISSWLVVLPQFMQLASTALITVLGAGLIIGGEFTIGMLVAFQAFLSAFYVPVNSLTQIARQMQELRVQVERVEDVMQSEPDPMESRIEAEDARELAGSLRVKGLAFGYGRLQPPVIRDISFEVAGGCSLGIAGGSGSGKSTLIGVLLGLYPRWSGEIEYGGVSIDSISRARFAGYAGIVRQEAVLFAGTVRENLKMWNDSITDEDMIRAAKDALIHDEIMSREGGYDSPVLARGVNFSGGQRQKMELARSLTGNPRILILDEATSALDSITEERILVNLKKRGVTSIVVAHRLSAIRDCDEILVMKGGRIAERGTHEQLIAQAGLYRRLVESDKNERS